MSRNRCRRGQRVEITILRPAIPAIRVPTQPADCSSTNPGAAGSVRCGFDQPRGTSTSVVPLSAAESATKPKLSWLSDVPAVTRTGETVILPIPTRVAAPLAVASTSRPKQAQSATPLALIPRAAIDPGRVYLDDRTGSLVGPAESVALDSVGHEAA